MVDLTELATFIDSIKNVMFAAMFVMAGFYVTIVPGIAPEYAGQWVGAAMMAAGVYIGTRVEKGKNEAVLLQTRAEECLGNAKK